SPVRPPRHAPSVRSRQRSGITARWPGSRSMATGSGPSSSRRKPISRRTDGTLCASTSAPRLPRGHSGWRRPAGVWPRGPGCRTRPRGCRPSGARLRHGDRLRADGWRRQAGPRRRSARALAAHLLRLYLCPHLCPTTLSEIAGALAQLGPLAAQVQPVFVSIDPQRDTPEALREYVESFDARILPLSGNAEQLARAAASVGVVFYKVPGPTPAEYT